MERFESEESSSSDKDGKRQSLALAGILNYSPNEQRKSDAQLEVEENFSLNRFYD